MKIGIDCRVLSIPICGVTRYLLNLLSALSEIDRNNQYLLFSDKNFLYDINLGNNFQKIVIKRNSNIIWEQFKLPTELNKNKIDIFHCPQNYGVSYFKRWKVILTIHDIIPKIFPHYWKNRHQIERLMYNLSLKISVLSSDKIIVDSENTKKDVMEIFNLSSQKIEVIPIATDPRFKPETSSIERVRKKYSITGDYILHAGGIGFNKNTITVLNTYEKLKKEGFSGQMVIFGQKKYFSKDVLKKASRITDVVFTDYVSDEDMPSLYSGASLFLYPSLYEGFGLPVLEAMSCGIPVIVSKNSSLSEVVKDAGLYINNPQDIDELLQKILIVLKTDNLKKELIQKGFNQVKKFSWKATAEKTLKVYEEMQKEVLA